ncbi:MAG: hypothetical protein K6G45_04315 [Lachnospiraceae bacterium]|nr:hypothetical protein [Lachnospiraceae bacterium]
MSADSNLKIDVTFDDDEFAFTGNDIVIQPTYCDISNSFQYKSYYDYDSEEDIRVWHSNDVVGPCNVTVYARTFAYNIPANGETASLFRIKSTCEYNGSLYDSYTLVIGSGEYYITDDDEGDDPIGATVSLGAVDDSYEYSTENTILVPFNVDEDMAEDEEFEMHVSFQDADGPVLTYKGVSGENLEFNIVGVGTTTVLLECESECYYGGASINITVVKKQMELSVRTNKTVYTYGTDEQVEFSVTTPSFASQGEYTTNITTNNSNVLTQNSVDNGKVYFSILGTGEATITAKYESDLYVAVGSATITVTSLSDAELSFDSDPVNVSYDSESTQTLTASISEAAAAENGEFAWSVEGDAVTISQSETNASECTFAIADVGRAIITCIYTSENYYGEASLTVNVEKAFISIELSGDKDSYAYPTDSSGVLSYTFPDLHSENYSAKTTSSDTSIADAGIVVSPDGEVLGFNIYKAGMVTFTVTYETEHYYAEGRITLTIEEVESPADLSIQLLPVDYGTDALNELAKRYCYIGSIEYLYSEGMTAFTPVFQITDSNGNVWDNYDRKNASWKIDNNEIFTPAPGTHVLNATITYKGHEFTINQPFHMLELNDDCEDLVVTLTKDKYELTGKYVVPEFTATYGGQDVKELLDIVYDDNTKVGTCKMYVRYRYGDPDDGTYAIAALKFTIEEAQNTSGETTTDPNQGQGTTTDPNQEQGTTTDPNQGQGTGGGSSTGGSGTGGSSTTGGSGTTTGGNNGTSGSGTTGEQTDNTDTSEGNKNDVKEEQPETGKEDTSKEPDSDGNIVTKTENEDGSVTTTTENVNDGSKTVVTENTDGSTQTDIAYGDGATKSITETADGATKVEVKDTDGTTGSQTVKTDESGNVTERNTEITNADGSRVEQSYSAEYDEDGNVSIKQETVYTDAAGTKSIVKETTEISTDTKEVEGETITVETVSTVRTTTDADGNTEEVTVSTVTETKKDGSYTATTTQTDSNGLTTVSVQTYEVTDKKTSTTTDETYNDAGELIEKVTDKAKISKAGTETHKITAKGEDGKAKATTKDYADGHSTATMTITNSDGSTLQMTENVTSDGKGERKVTEVAADGTMTISDESYTDDSHLWDGLGVSPSAYTSPLDQLWDKASGNAANETTVEKKTYEITSKSEGATVKSIDTTKTTATIPDAVVDAKGESHMVTALGANALAGSSITKLEVGQNVKVLKKNSLNDTKLKTIEIKSKQLKASSQLAASKNMEPLSKIKIKVTKEMSKSDFKKLKKQLKKAGITANNIKKVKF